MELSTLSQNYILSQGMAYLPAVTPIDYGGMLAVTLTLHLSSGRMLCHSTLEIPEGSDEQRYAAALELLRGEVSASGLRPRCDYLDPEATRQYRILAGLPALTTMISGCLCGECCRYDGRSNPNREAVRMIREGLAVPVCPESAGRLPAPRPPCEQGGDRVVSKDGTDLTEAFHEGARRVLHTAKVLGIQTAILKERSPSCGVHMVYDGSFTGKRIPGMGIAARLLSEAGLVLRTEEEL